MSNSNETVDILNAILHNSELNFAPDNSLGIAFYSLHKHDDKKDVKSLIEKEIKIARQEREKEIESARQEREKEREKEIEFARQEREKDIEFARQKELMTLKIALLNAQG
jgi:hypothetical protein